MKTLLTTTAIASAALLAGWAGLAQAETSSAPDVTETSGGCCDMMKSGMMKGGMMGMMNDGAPATTEPADRVTLDERQQESIDKLAKAYLSIRESLANDSAEGVAAKFKTVHEAAHALAESDDAGLKEAANKVATAAHDEPQALDAAREAFKPLSEALADLVRIAPPSDDAAANLYVAYCPMAEASWLQTSKEIANPYMGQDMLKCGSVKSTLKGDAS